MASEALLPCPFCGGPAELWKARANRRAWIACVKRCLAVTREFSSDEEAIAHWNTRDLPTIRSWLAEQGLAVVPTSGPDYRLLRSGEPIQSGDQALADDCQSVGPLSLALAEANDRIRAFTAERDRLRDPFVAALAALAAAISLLERSPKTAAPSDQMFDIMLADYKGALRDGRAAFTHRSHP